MKQLVITISRQYGSGGRILAKRLSEELEIPFYDKEIIQKVSEQTGLTEQYIRQTESRPTGSFLFDLYSLTQTMPLPDQVFVAQSKYIQEISKQPCVIVGRCADYVLKGRAQLLTVFLAAPFSARVKRKMEREGLDRRAAEGLVRRMDRQRRAYYQAYTGWTWGDPRHFDLYLDTVQEGMEGCVSRILEAYRALPEE